MARCISTTAGDSSAVEAVALEQPDPVLAGHRAAAVEGLGDDLVEGGLGSHPRGLVTGWRDDERVEVAVARVRDVGDEHVVPLTDGLDPGEHLGHAAHGDADVLGEHRPEPLEGGVGEAAGGEHRVGLGVVLGAGGPGRTGGLETREDGLGLGDARCTRAVDPGEQDGLAVGLDAEVLPVVDGGEAVPVEQLERRGHLPGAGQRRDGLAGPDERVEEPDDGVLRRPRRAQPHGDLGDEAQGALGADEQRHEVVAGDALGRLAADADELARSR